MSDDLDPQPDPQLARLVQDAVADVEPADRLAEIRSATGSTPRRWWVGAGGAVLAAAAAVTAVAVLGNEPPRAVDPSGPAPTTTSPSPTGGSAVAAYFIGDSPTGPRLYREFQQVPSPAPGLAGLDLLAAGAVDPDYRTEWTDGSFRSLSDPEAGVVHVELGDLAPAEPSELALQQLAYTLRAGFQEPLDVVVHRGGAVVAEVSAAPQLEVLSLVNLSDPSEGQPVSGTLLVRGVASSNEANVPWRIERDGVAVDEGFFTAAGWLGPRLFPFSGSVDVSSLEPGSYTLVVETDDAAGGAEGPGAYADTRTFVLE